MSIFAYQLGGQKNSIVLVLVHSDAHSWVNTTISSCSYLHPTIVPMVFVNIVAGYILALFSVPFSIPSMLVHLGFPVLAICSTSAYIYVGFPSMLFL